MQNTERNIPHSSGLDYKRRHVFLIKLGIAGSGLEKTHKIVK